MLSMTPLLVESITRNIEVVQHLHSRSDQASLMVSHYTTLVPPLRLCIGLAHEAGLSTGTWHVTLQKTQRKSNHVSSPHPTVSKPTSKHLHLVKGDESAAINTLKLVRCIVNNGTSTNEKYRT